MRKCGCRVCAVESPEAQKSLPVIGLRAAAARRQQQQQQRLTLPCQDNDLDALHQEVVVQLLLRVTVQLLLRPE